MVLSTGSSSKPDRTPLAAEPAKQFSTAPEAAP